MGCGSSQAAVAPDPVVPTAPSAQADESGQDVNAIDEDPKKPAAPADQLPECRLRIFHVNDVYSLDNLPLLRSCIKAMSEGTNVLTTLGGDFVAPSLLSSIDHGHGMVAVMNATPIDAVCFGNHESDIPFLSLVQRVQEFNGVWLNSNMPSLSEESAFEGKLADHHLVKLAEGRSVALIGLLCGGGKDAALYRKDAFNGHANKITPVLEAVEDAVARTQHAYPEADCIVPMTHQNMPDDIELAKRDFFFPVILGGHDHGVFNEEHNGTHIVKAGADAFNVAVVDLLWAAGTPAQSAPTVSVQMIPLTSVEQGFAADPELQECVKTHQRPAEELKEVTLAVLPSDPLLTSVGARAQECTMATLICSGLRAVAGTDGALINAGNIRGNKVYIDGRVRFADLAAECPFPSAQIVVEVPGSVLSKAVSQSRAPWHGAPSPRPGAEPGTSSTALHFDDLMRADPDTEFLLEVAGQPIEAEKLYSIVIDSFLMRSDPVLKEYAEAHPENVAPDETGQPALPMLVQYFCDKIWATLCDVDGDGLVQLEEVDEFFDLADTDGNGELDVDEIMVAMSLKLGGLDVTRVLAQQCVSCADADGNGKVSREELRNFMQRESAARANRTI
ncbi:unnamed protein product [Effrenium voratum]|uniref:EF-hand domain-containing protein n=1 Tax=Effrenium voratum TaxID=2562239 RepID=A0AA36JCS3_9DINO|nr:unnamed protein product [Effrenium voratum]